MISENFIYNFLFIKQKRLNKWIKKWRKNALIVQILFLK